MNLSIKQINDMNLWLEYIDSKNKPKDTYRDYEKKKIKNQDRARRKNRLKRTYNDWS